MLQLFTFCRSIPLKLNDSRALNCVSELYTLVLKDENKLLVARLAIQMKEDEEAPMQYTARSGDLLGLPYNLKDL